jgi:uncharacterized protein YndB with AHSA1/START domain
MARSQWHRFYTSVVAAPPARLFRLLSDMPNYTRWLPQSQRFSHTTAVEPYPVRLGSRYHDGRPDESGKDWWGTVTGFQPPGSIDFHHTIRVAQLRATVDVHIHYSFEGEDGGTRVNRWLSSTSRCRSSSDRCGRRSPPGSTRRTCARWRP